MEWWNGGVVELWSGGMAEQGLNGHVRGAGSPPRMFVADSKYGAMSSGDVDNYCVRMPEVLDTSVRMTIVWHDPPVRPPLDPLMQYE